MSTILYIDDNQKYLVASLKNAAQTYGMDLIAVSTIVEGLELLREFYQQVDAVILDLAYPPEQMQGLEGLQKLKERHAYLPVVVLTDSDSAENITTAVKCIKIGAYDYVGKSTLNPLHLFHILENAIRQSVLQRVTEKGDGSMPFLEDGNIYLDGQESQWILCFGFEMSALIVDAGNLEEQLLNASSWTLRMLKCLSGFYNGILRLRVRHQKIPGDQSIRSFLGFEVRERTIEKVQYQLSLIIDDVYQLIKDGNCPYKFTVLKSDEIKKLWTFEQSQQLLQFHRKPIKVNVQGYIGYKAQRLQTDGQDEYYLPPAPRFGSLNDAEVYATMSKMNSSVAITITSTPISLNIDEASLVKRAITGKMRIVDQPAENTTLLDYYKMIDKEARSGFLVTVVLSCEGDTPMNSLTQSIFNVYFGGRINAESKATNGLAANNIDFPVASEIGRLSYYYLPEEAVNVVHLPFPVITHSRVLPIITTSFAYYPEKVSHDGVLLGVKTTAQDMKKIFADEDSLKRHFYILGQTGTGKSTLLKTMALDVINKRKGCCIIDPHGDLFTDIRKLIPSHRERDIVIFDTANLDRSAKLNVLEFDYEKPEQKSMLIQEMVKAFNMNYDMKQQGGFMFEMFFRAAVLLALDPNSIKTIGTPTLRDVKKIVQDEDLRNQLISMSSDRDARAALENVNRMSGEQSWYNFIPYINSKIAVFTDNAYVDVLFNAKENSLDIREVMDQNKILLVRLDKGQIGFNNLNLIGGVLLSKLIMAIMSRSNQPKEERKDFYLFIDEFHNFLHGHVASALAEVRKYNVGLVLANQTLGQLNQEMIDAVLGNVGNMAFFRPGVNDFHKIEHYLTPDFSREEVLKLPNFNCIARLLIDNVPSVPFVFQTIKSV